LECKGITDISCQPESSCLIMQIKYRSQLHEKKLQFNPEKKCFLKIQVYIPESEKKLSITEN
jgi:hypothetical protein